VFSGLIFEHTIRAGQSRLHIKAGCAAVVHAWDDTPIW
jgi:hypothetical protein